MKQSFTKNEVIDELTKKTKKPKWLVMMMVNLYLAKREADRQEDREANKRKYGILQSYRWQHTILSEKINCREHDNQF